MSALFAFSTLLLLETVEEAAQALQTRRAHGRQIHLQQHLAGPAAQHLVHPGDAVGHQLAAAVAATIDQVSIIGADQRITALPEFAELYSTQPGTDWNRLGRSFPGTEEIPVAAGAEENLLCLESDRYEGEDMFIRDFGWTIRRFGIATADPRLDRSIEDAYIRAIAAGLWQNTIAEVNSDQYWAEGVQSFFDANNEETDERDQVHNQIDTRDELREYDPLLYGLLVEVFGETEWRPECASGA